MRERNYNTNVRIGGGYPLLNKGFTLIELLAVIVILAIIALIATPIILNIIGDTKTSSVVRSGELYLDAVEQAIARKNLSEKFEPLECIVQENGNLNCDGEELKIDTTGSRPIYGTILLQNGKILEITNLELDNYILKKGINESLIIDRLSDELKPQGDYLMINPNVNSSETTFLGSTIKRNQVESVEIKNRKRVPSNAIASWDVSAKKDGSVMAWYIDTDNNGLYEVYIGGDGGVRANPNLSFLFARFSNVKTMNITYLDTSEVTNMSSMFDYCTNLKKIIGLDSFDTTKVTTMRGMFYECKSLNSINLSSFNTGNVTTMHKMFYGCISLATLDVSKFDTSQVTDMYEMFYNCTNLKKIIGLDSFDTTKVTTIRGMFYECKSLNSINLSSFNTSQVTNMSYMFNNCNNLEELDLSNFNTSKVTNMNSMFRNCSKLTSLNLSGANFANVTSYENIFNNTPKLETIYVSSLSKQFVTDRLVEVNKSASIIQEV